MPNSEIEFYERHTVGKYRIIIRSTDYKKYEAKIIDTEKDTLLTVLHGYSGPYGALAEGLIYVHSTSRPLGSPGPIEETFFELHHPSNPIPVIHRLYELVQLSDTNDPQVLREDDQVSKCLWLLIKMFTGVSMTSVDMGQWWDRLYQKSITRKQ